jgi:hypothetical protein
MLSSKDEIFIREYGADPEKVRQQLENYKNGFPFLEIDEAATVGNGIIDLDNSQVEENIKIYEGGIASGLKPVKFVPASGAASRMFKGLFAALKECEKSDDPDEALARNATARQFLANREKFAFYNDLRDVWEAADYGSGSCKKWLDFLLNKEGLNYGSMPKGLLKFHKYPDGSRTPFEEHIVEGADYVTDSRRITRIHYTVSKQHVDLFREFLSKVEYKYEKKLGIIAEISLSIQKPSTDVVAVDMNNEPFRKPDGHLLFRPGGHGALLENLNELDADLIFIKNIDNVVPDRLKQITIVYKKVLAGLLLKYQEELFYYQRQLNEKHHVALGNHFLVEAANFLENVLNTKPLDNQYYTEKENLYHYLKNKYNRPLRVCGMVRNEGEPGGGPFWARNPDGTVSLQIVEKSQIDLNNTQQQNILKHTTHFNPVDIVCGIKNYRGEKYDLTSYTDPETGFISKKSENGRELKAQELPGLWNGGMSDWNTIFAEVPVETFNPVKTVNDLLRDKHL